jgi:hypothetical protein
VTRLSIRHFFAPESDSSKISTPLTPLVLHWRNADGHEGFCALERPPPSWEKLLTSGSLERDERLGSGCFRAHTQNVFPLSLRARAFVCQIFSRNYTYPPGLYASSGGSASFLIFTRTVCTNERLMPLSKLICGSQLDFVNSRVSFSAGYHTAKRTSWPEQRVILRHLELTPFLDLGVNFDAEALLAEARALVGEFVVHRPYDQSGKTLGGWKSLGLQTVDGDASKTGHFSQYGYAERPPHVLTEVARRCPRTMSFLGELFDLTRCSRIRFMLLEPGAKISVHSDAPGKDHSLAVNIALNMPEGCRFAIDTKPEGDPTEFTRDIPFRQGTAFAVNTAKYHFVENLSQESRFHIIVHGPPRISELIWLSRARKQNSLDNDELLNRLAVKRAGEGLPLGPGDDFYHEWTHAIFQPSEFARRVEVSVQAPSDWPENDRQFLAARVTGASLFPIPYELESHHCTVDPKYLEAIQARLPAGSLIKDTRRFLYEILAAGKMAKRQGWGLLRHEEFELQIPGAGASSAPVPAAVLDTVMIPPADAGAAARTALTAGDIRQLLVADQNHVFYFNTEPLRQFAPESFRPRMLLSVASGLKPITILRDLFSEEETHANFLDYSRPALAHFASVLAANGQVDTIRLLAEGLVRSGSDESTAHAKAQRNFSHFLAEEFGGDYERYRVVRDRIRPQAWLEADFFLQHELLVSMLKCGDSAYFWHSNAWRTHGARYRLSLPDLRLNYRALVTKIADARGLRSWLNKRENFYEAVVGPSLDKPVVILSEDLAKKYLRAEDFEEIWPIRPWSAHISEHH